MISGCFSEFACVCSPNFIDTKHLKTITTESLVAAVKQSKVFVLLLTRELLTRPWCVLEVYTALENDIPIVPVKIERQRNNYSYGIAAEFLSNLEAYVYDKDYMKRTFDVPAWSEGEWSEIQSSVKTGERAEHPGNPLTLRIVQDLLAAKLPALKAEE